MYDTYISTLRVKLNQGRKILAVIYATKAVAERKPEKPFSGFLFATA